MAIPAEKVGVEKVVEKLAEKRRALGRGLESLLPGPRVGPGNDPTLAQNARKDGVHSGGPAAPTAVEEPAAGALGDGRGRGAPATASEGAGATVGGVSGTVDLQAMAARRTADGVPVLDLALGLI